MLHLRDGQLHRMVRQDSIDPSIFLPIGGIRGYLGNDILRDDLPGLACRCGGFEMFVEEL